MKRTQEMFNYLNEFCGKSITSKLFSLKTNETNAASFESNDIQSFKKLENILEKYIEYKKNKVCGSEKEIEPIKKVLKELKEEIWDEKLMDQLKMLSKSEKNVLEKKGKIGNIFKGNKIEKNSLQSLSNLNASTFHSSKKAKLSKTQKIMKNFYKYVELERNKTSLKENKKAEIKKKTEDSILDQGFPIFEIKSKNISRRQSLKEFLHKRDFVEFVKDTPKKEKKKGSKYVLSPFHSLISNKRRNEDLLEDLFRNN
jgi:hypothetical protein